MDFINEGKTGKVKLQAIFDDIYEDCDSAIADNFYKGLKLEMDDEGYVDLANAGVQLYIRDFIESHETDYQYDLLKNALEPYYDHEYDLDDEDIEESYEVLEEDEYLDENATFEEIIYRMECAEIYEDLYNAAMLIVDPKLQNMVTEAIQQCEDDGDDVEEAYSIVTSDLLDMHINDKNEEFLDEGKEIKVEGQDTHSILSRVFAHYPDISEEDEDYLNGLTYDELVIELKNRGWDDLLEESKKITESSLDLSDMKNDVYNALGDVAFKYDPLFKEMNWDMDTCKDAFEDSIDWFMDKFFIENDEDLDESKKVESEENPQEFDYRLLSRLKSDCDYYLGNGNRNAEHCLWAKNEQGQIAKMREIYNKLKEKPEWLSEEDINNYAKEMGVVDLPSTMNGIAEKEIQDMIDRAEKRSKENLDESRDRFNREELVAVKNSIDTALDDLQILSNGTTGAMEDKVLVNDLRSVSQSLGSYLNRVFESKNIIKEAEDMEAVKDEIEAAKEKTDNTNQELEQVEGSINVLKTDEESAIDGYDTFIEDTKEVVNKELADAIEDQMEEIKADEEEHIEKLDTIKNALEESSKLPPDFKVDFEGDMTIDMGYTNEEGAEKRAKELLGDVAKSSNVRDLNVDVKDVKKIERENKELTEDEEKFSGVEFEKNIPHVMRFKEYNRVNDNDLFWVTQQFFNEDDVKNFAEAFKNTNFEKAFVTVRDLSTYSFEADSKENVFVVINKDGTYDMSGYIAACEEGNYDDDLYSKKEEFLDANINVDTGDISPNLDLGGLGALAGLVASEEKKDSDKKLTENTIVWTSEYEGDEETAEEAYQEYLDEFEPSAKTPKSFEMWLEDTKEVWFEAEAERYKEENPDKDPDKLTDFELDEINAELYDRVEKEIEANMDDLKEQYEEYCEEIQKEMTSPLDKERWLTGWYEQDAQAQWEVKDEDFSNSVWPMIESQCKEDILILLGSVGRWDGTSGGGKIIYADEKNLRDTMADYDEIRVEADDNNQISINYIHHDGTDTMYLYTIPEDLTELAKAMGYDDPDELDTDIRQDYVDMAELAKHVDKLTPVVYKGGNV